MANLNGSESVSSQGIQSFVTGLRHLVKSDLPQLRQRTPVIAKGNDSLSGWGKSNFLYRSEDAHRLSVMVPQRVHVFPFESRAVPPPLFQARPGLFPERQFLFQHLCQLSSDRSAACLSHCFWYVGLLPPERIVRQHSSKGGE